MSLSSGSIRRPVAVTMLFLGVVFLGFISFSRLPINLLPEIAYPRLIIHTRYAGVGPAEIERFITEPIEQVVSRVPGVERVESASREGTSLITLRFAWGTDMDFAALNVREQLDNIADRLPEQADRPSVLRTDPNAEPVMALSVTGDRSLWSLKELAENVFSRRLEQIDGVAEAAVTGGLTREIQVEVDPRALQAYGITLDDVANALDAANASQPGGTVMKGRYRYSLRTLGEFQSVAEIRDVRVRPSTAAGAGAGAGGGSGAAQGSGGGETSSGGAGSSGAGSFTPAVRVGDVATVTDGFEERQSIAHYDGQEAIGLVVFKESGSNTVRVDEAVREVVAQLNEQFPDVGLVVATSQARFISQAISNVVSALLQGAVLAFLVLFLFLRDWRYPIAIGLAIPISVVATFSLLDAAGVSLNVMTLGGLALGVGMLVDNSIVVLENIFRHRELGLRAAAAAAAGAEEVQSAVTSSTLTTIAVFGPILYIEGIAGELFGALSLAVAFSLLASLVVALTLLPAMAARWRGAPAGAGTGEVPEPAVPSSEQRAASSEQRWAPLAAFDRAFARFTTWYQRALVWSLDHKGRVLGVAVAMFALSIAAGATLDRDVLPDVDQGEFTVRVELERGTPLDETARIVSRLERVLLADAEVAAVFTRIGRQTAIEGIQDEASGLHTAVIDVRLEGDASTDDAIARLRPALAALPAGAVTIESGSATALGQLLGGGGADVAVRVAGEDLDAALAYAGTLAGRLNDVASLTNVRLGTELGQPEVRILIDRERAASYGIGARRVAETITAYMQGTVATNYVDFDERVPVVVRLPDETRHSLDALELVRVDGVPLSQLVRLEERLGPTEIRRVDQNRQVSVLADVRSGGLADAVADAEAVIAAAPPPTDLRVEIGGENDEMRQGFRALAFAFLLSLLLVFMILAAEFESFAHPFVVLLTVPLAIVGASLSLFVAGAGINVMSLIGLIILVGIVDNGAVVNIDYVNQLRERGHGVREAVVEGGLARMRPILMTTATTLLGVLPMALGLGRGGELQAPLAITVLGGLFTATALTLIVIPVMYEMVEGVRQRTRVRLGLAADARAGWMNWRQPGRQGARDSGVAPTPASASASDP